MTVTLNLTPELEERLTEEASLHGVPLEDFALQLLAQHLPRKHRQARLLALLDAWMNEDDGESQKETAEFLVAAIDEDRTSSRKLFPPEMKGVTW